MICSFKDAGTEDIFYGKRSRCARQTCAQTLWRIAARKPDQLDSVDTLDELRIPPGNQLETLSDERQGQHSIRINPHHLLKSIHSGTRIKLVKSSWKA